MLINFIWWLSWGSQKIAISCDFLFIKIVVKLQKQFNNLNMIVYQNGNNSFQDLRFFCPPSKLQEQKFELSGKVLRQLKQILNKRINSLSLVYISQYLDSWLRGSLLLYFYHHFDWHLLCHISLINVSIFIGGESTCGCKRPTLYLWQDWISLMVALTEFIEASLSPLFQEVKVSSNLWTLLWSSCVALRAPITAPVKAAGLFDFWLLPPDDMIVR